jgi:hypothetical protein
MVLQKFENMYDKGYNFGMHVRRRCLNGGGTSKLRFDKILRSQRRQELFGLL